MDTATAVELTHDQHVEQVSTSAQQLASALVNATNAGVPPVRLLPELVSIFKASGLMDASSSLGGLGIPGM